MTFGSAPAGARFVDGPYSWVRLAISIVLGSIGSVGMWSAMVIIPTIQAEFGVDRGTATIPFTMTMLGFAVGNVIAGRLTDRWGIMAPMIMAGLALGLGFVWSAWATSIWEFAIIQGVFVGLGTAVAFGPLISNISHWFRRRRGVAMSVTAAGNYAGGVIWPLVLQPLIQTEGWRTAYIFVGIFCVVTMVAIALLLRQSLPQLDQELGQGGVQHGAQSRGIDCSPHMLQILLAIAGVGCCMAMAMPQVHILAYSVDLGYGAARGVEMMALMYAGGLVSRLASGFLADYIGGIRTLLLGSVLQCLALLIYLPFDGLTALYVISFGFGLAQGGIVPSYAIIVREYLPAHEAGERVGLVIMATIFGMALGGWASGWIHDMTGSYQAAFVHGVAWNLLNIGIIAILLLRSRKSELARA